MHVHGTSRPAAARGFTLIETMITLVIFVLAAAVVVPAVSKSGLAELRTSASKVAGTVRATYDRAALGGRTYRLAIDLDQQVLRVEVDQSRVQQGPGLAGLAAMFSAGGGAAGEPRADAEAEPEQVQPPKELLALFGEGGDEGSPSGLADFKNAGHDFALPKDARLMDVWIEGMDQPVSQGVAYLQFFPGGYTQSALLHVTNPEGTVFTVKVAPLTGATTIVDSYVEAPK